MIAVYMPASAAVLVFISAIAHVLWNLIGKRNQPSTAFFFAAALASAILLFPLLIIYRDNLSSIPPSVWLLLIFTGCAQSVYYFSLAGAYRCGDLSMAYPLIRALPILLVVVVTFLLGRRDHLTPASLIGMQIVLFGCLMVPIQDFRKVWQNRPPFKTIVFVVLAALGTTGYMLADDTALRVLRSKSDLSIPPFALPLVYIELETILTGIFLFLFILMRRTEREELNQVRIQSWRTATLTGLILTGGYILVLVAMGQARDVSYVTTFRQISIPMGALAGILILKEPAYLPRLIGIATIFVGLILVGLN